MSRHQKFQQFDAADIINNIPCEFEVCKNQYGVFAIIEGTYPQVCSGHPFSREDFKRYSLYLVIDNEIIDTQAWFDEEDLVLLPTIRTSTTVKLVDDYLESRMRP